METPPRTAADDRPPCGSSEEPRAHSKLADGNISTRQVLEPLWSGSPVSTARSGPSVASCRVGIVTDGTPGADDAASVAAHTDQGQRRETTDQWSHDTQRSAFTHTGSNSAGNSSSAITTAANTREIIHRGLNVDRFVAFRRRPDTLWSIDGASSGGISEDPASRTISTATSEHCSSKHETRSRSMTAASPALLLPYTRYGTIHTSNPSSYLDKNLVCDTASPPVATTEMMLSPTGSEVSYLTMDSDSRTSSRTSTPTSVRTRPRLPTGMVRHKDILVAAAAAAAVSTSAAATPPPQPATRVAEDIVCDFDSLGRTDFVRKYSTKIRSKNDYVDKNAGPGDGHAPHENMSPQTTLRSLPTSPISSLTVVGDREAAPRPRPALAPQRSRSVKLKLELLKEARKTAENNAAAYRNVDKATLVRMVRNEMQDGQKKDSMSTCDMKEQKPSLDKIHEAGVANSHKDKNDSFTIRQLHMKNLSKSQPHLSDDRMSEVFTRRHRSSSPKEFSPTPADMEVRDTFSKSIVLDRRLRVEDKPKDSVTAVASSEAHVLCSAGIQSPPLISSAPVVATEMDNVSSELITGASSAVQSKRSVRVAKPAAVHWQLDKDKSENPSGQPVNVVNDRLREISEAEDEGVAGMDDDVTDFRAGAGRHKSKLKPGNKGKKVIEWAVDSIPDITRAAIPDEKRDRDSPKSPDSGDSSSSGQSKSHYGRFLTHPPSKERSAVPEGGPRDTNGFGSLKDSLGESEPVTVTAMTPQLSATSLDSHLCGGEVELPPTYPEVVQDVTAESTDMDHLERKNSKNLKQKSKSDPCGEKQKEVIRMQPNLQTSVQSTPLLIEEPANTSQDSLGSLQPDSERGQKSVSDSSLLSVRSSQDTTPDARKSEDNVVLRLPHSPRKRNNRVSKDAKSSPSKDSLEIHSVKSRSSKSAKTTESFQSPVTQSPESQSPDSTLDKKSSHKQSTAPTSSLTLPFPKKNVTALTRSQSSASVFLSKGEAYRNSTPSPGSSRQKDLAKKRPPLLESFSSTPAGSLDIGSSKKDRSWASASTSGYFPSLEPIFSQSSLSVFESSGDTQDKRDLILQEFYTSEDQYVESLQMLVERYMIPMKTQGVLDSGLVDDIFYKVNEIYMHHATFLTFLGKALKDWHSQTSTIGDIIYKNFSKQTVIESYVSFIEHFPRAEKVLDEISAKSSFQKFIDVCDRDNRIRLPLKANIVKPAQRIPRYELLVKRLLENTPADHPDHALLLQAESSLHHLALQINSTKEARQEEDYQDTLKKLELLLITDLVAVDRRYIRHDMVQLMSRKDQCCVWLFSDLAVFSSVKRKSGPVNRKTMLLQSPTGNDFIENCKHKMWLKISLEDLEIVQMETSPARQQLVDKDVLEYDMALLTEIRQLADRLNCEHMAMEEALRELVHHVNKQLAEHQRKSPPPEANKVQLMANTTEGLDHLALVFPSQDKRQSWEGAFILAKQKLAALAEGKPPEFMQSLPITKTRAGMQFSCAAPMEGFNERHYHDVWVCNSDGYVGHMCLLSLQPEPIVTLNTPVPGCNSRILCICAVPALLGAHKRKLSRRKIGITNSTPPQIHVDKVKVQRNHSNVSSSAKRGRSRQASESVSIQSSEEGSSSSEDSGGSEDSVSTDDEATDNAEEKHRKISTGSGRVKHLLSGSKSAPQESKALDPKKSTMWLGTEDGCIHVFPSNENLKTTKNKVKLQHHNSVLSLCYIEYKVFAALSNGDIVVYKNNTDGTWDLSNHSTLSLGAGSSPVSKMLPVAGRLWCACQQDIYVVNPDNLQVEVSFCGDPDSKKPVHCMATSGNGVWLSSQGSSRVSLYHALSHQYLAQVSVAQPVSLKLQNADDIIRQHKTACLRVTSLLTCKDLLWIGTSAGVILTLPLPKISQATSKGSVVLGQIQGLMHGHTGHVRFLTSVDMTPTPRRRGGGAVGGGHGGGHGGGGAVQGDDSPASTEPSPRPWTSRRMSIGVHSFTMATKMLVISGGDGYEDFSGTGAASECTGRDDSTNHLLTWHV